MDPIEDEKPIFLKPDLTGCSAVTDEPGLPLEDAADASVSAAGAVAALAHPPRLKPAAVPSGAVSLDVEATFAQPALLKPDVVPWAC